MTPTLPPLLTPHRRRWLVALLANGLGRALLAASGVVLLRWALSAGQAPLPALVLLPALAIGVVAHAWLQRREMMDAEGLAQHYIAHVRLRLFDRLALLTPEQAQRRSRGGVLLRFIGDVQALRNWIGRGIARGLVAGSTLLALWILMLSAAPALGAATALILAAAGLAMWRQWGPMYDATAVSRRRQALVAGFMQDRIAGLSTLQGFGRAKLERERLNKLHLRLRRALQERADWRGRHRAVTTLAAGALLLVVAAQALLTLPDPFTAAAPWLGLNAGSSLLALLMLPALRTLGQAADAWVAAQVARARVAEFLGGHAPQGRGTEQVGAHPDLALHAPTWAGRVDGPEAVVSHGARVAISGPAAAGKTSLLLLMAGLQTPSSGAVYLGGTELHQLDAASMRRCVALLSPDLPLLRGTVRENICAAGEESADAQFEQALSLSGLSRLLPGLPDGLDTRVRDAGSNLSHGQRKAIQLARCLAGRPAILLIDDPAACLPGNVEEGMHRLLAGFDGTVIFATTDPALATLADEIWTFEAGSRRAAWAVSRNATIGDAVAH